MNDLKVFDESQDNLQEKVRVVEETSTAMGMELGLKKCAVARIIGGKVVQGGSLPLSAGAAIEEFEYGVPTDISESTSCSEQSSQK